MFQSYSLGLSTLARGERARGLAAHPSREWSEKLCGVLGCEEGWRCGQSAVGTEVDALEEEGSEAHMDHMLVFEGNFCSQSGHTAFRDLRIKK